MGRTPGALVTLEGGEASGKTTQCRLLVRWLHQAGIPVVATREPGGTGLGERLRTLLLDPALPAPAPAAEVLLFAAARAEAVAEIVRPALCRGAVVVCDRFVDSSLAYQGYGLGVDLSFIRSVNAGATSGLWPDVTLLLDLPPAMARARRRESATRGDRIERRPPGYHDQVRSGYLELARHEPERFRTVEAGAAAEAVHRAVVDAVRPVLAARGFCLPDGGDASGGGGGR